eukprot:gnl/TRDRNA2_/TRDRNA2_177223_c8_seq23.p1 gnl/TRDRNA2_/TRDRNA2_177223_c8~~gnl/TRDRNA2_/TRDRNA2_177223_c8_seq23.p1  ORF type:complete len:148 (-),score=3.73 gnl/TRDRNA2_/TRDRNA2_177223_c8_seq23:148-591(-)
MLIKVGSRSRRTHLRSTCDLHEGPVLPYTKSREDCRSPRGWQKHHERSGIYAYTPPTALDWIGNWRRHWKHLMKSAGQKKEKTQTQAETTKNHQAGQENHHKRKPTKTTRAPRKKQKTKTNRTKTGGSTGTQENQHKQEAPQKFRCQ